MTARRPEWYVRAVSYALRKPARVAAKLLANLMERDPLSTATRSFAATDEAQLLAGADEFNRKAELYWQTIKSQEPARNHVLNKPFGSVKESADVLYRLGLLLHELRAGIGHTVLDFGAGSCWLSALLARLGCQTVSVDVSPTALELGRQLLASESRIPGGRVRFVSYDGHRLPLPDASVDRVVCFDAFHHIPNQSEILAEFYRVLGEGGRVVLAEPGEGHSHADQSVFETKAHGVLENELDLADLVRRAEAVGFRDFEVKPYPGPDAMSVSPRDYLRLINGREEVFPFEALQSSLRHYYLLAFDKGAFRFDTRSPHRLRASLRAEVGELRGCGGSLQRLAVKIRNGGDTHWLRAVSAGGGFVQIAGHLLDRSGALIQHDYLPRHTLPRDVAPAEEIAVMLDVPLPDELGTYSLRLDLVDDKVVWFSQAGSPTLDVALVVDARSEGSDTDGLGAAVAMVPTTNERLTALPGTSVPIRVMAWNTGRLSWPSAPEPRAGCVALGGHLLDAQGKTLARDVLRAYLERPVAPEEKVEFRAAFKAPLAPGSYRLRLDLVQEEVCWFEERGSLPLELVVEVGEGMPDSTNPGLLCAKLEAVGALPASAAAGSLVPLALRVKNCGNTRWLHGTTAGSAGHVAIGGHLLTPAGEVLDHDYFRAVLPRDVMPGETLETQVRVPWPSTAGSHVVELDLVDEGVAWFQQRGSATLRFAIVATKPQP